MVNLGRRVALLVWALAAAAGPSACGGRADESLLPPHDDAACAVSPCPSNSAWDPVTCACVLVVDAGARVTVDADGKDVGVDSASAGGDAPPEVSEASYPEDQAAPDVQDLDTMQPDVAYPDVWIVYPDSPYITDAPLFTEGPEPPDTGIICPPIACPQGYVLDAACQCLACPDTCPAGQTPGYGCSGCIACPYACPKGFDLGPGCGCVPHGTDGGPAPADGGGVTCLLEGRQYCPAGTWCQLGTCPNGSTQFGCYCNADGTATCDLSCPRPPDCTIPGEGTCPYGTSCVYGSCPDLLVCSCQGAGAAYCNTYSCSDGGPMLGFDAGPDSSGGPGSCLLEGYLSCSAGTFCSLGTCPDGTTQFGCVCNSDGTANCDLTCPPPPPCEIPGQGTCPSGAQCTFGTCSNDGGGAQLVCNCYAGGANCYTTTCGTRDGGPFSD